jgi:hypothetical protein
MHVAAAGVQVDDGITDKLTGPVVGDVAAAARLVDVDSVGGEDVCARQDVPASAVASHAEREDMGMFDEEQCVADAAGPTLLDQRSLQGERLDVGDTSEATHVKEACRLISSTHLTHVHLTHVHLAHLP